MGDAFIKQKFATGGGGGSGLPAEYQEVTYIQSTGTQYIDTGVQPTASDDYMIDYAISSYSTSTEMPVFGVFVWGGANYRIMKDNESTNGVRMQLGSSSINLSTPDTNRHKVELKSGVAYYDGTSKGSISGVAINGNMYLFAQNRATVGVYSYGNIRLYRFKYGTVRDYIPCYRKADNVAGLYDMVGKQFYTNQGTGEFLIGAEVGLLPSEFQQVEYIQSNGTQSSSEYINTGITPAFGDTVKLMATHTAWGSSTSTWMCLYGSQTGSFIITRPTSYSEAYMAVGGSGAYVGVIKPALNEKFYVEFATSTSSTTVSGKYNASSFSITRGTTAPQYNAYIFAMNNAGSVIDYSFYKIEYLKHLRESNKVRNYIPCYCTTSVTAYQGATQTTASGGTAGLYDTVEGKFYINSGSGSFAIGGRVYSQADGEPEWDTNTVLLLHGDTIIDASYNGVIFTNQNVAIGDDGKFDKCLVFNGNAKLSADAQPQLLFGTGDFTIDFWLYITTSWSSQGSAGIISQISGDRGAGFVVYRDTTQGNTLNLRLVGANNFNSSASPTLNTWEHWAIVRSNGTLKWYKNGVLQRTGSNSGDVTDLSYPLAIGYSNWGSYLYGKISELRVSIVARWTSNFTPPTEPYNS